MSKGVAPSESWHDQQHALEERLNRQLQAHRAELAAQLAAQHTEVMEVLRAQAAPALQRGPSADRTCMGMPSPAMHQPSSGGLTTPVARLEEAIEEGDEIELEKDPEIIKLLESVRVKSDAERSIRGRNTGRSTAINMLHRKLKGREVRCLTAYSAPVQSHKGTSRASTKLCSVLRSCTLSRP